MRHGGRRQRENGLRRDDNNGGKTDRDNGAKHRRREAQRQAAPLRGLDTAKTAGGAEQQHAGQATADRGLRQCHVDGEKPDPGNGDQQSIDDEDDDRSEGRARNNGPHGDRQQQTDERDVEYDGHIGSHVHSHGHAGGDSRRNRRAMSCATIAPDICTNSQTPIILSAPNGHSASGNSPSTTRPRPRLSALVSACRRVSESGKRSRPTVPAMKKNAPPETASTTNISRAKLIASPSFPARKTANRARW